MGFREYVSLAIASIMANKLRSALTLLGIVIGVASVITMVSIGEGARVEVTGELEGMGSNMVFIQPNYHNEDVRMGDIPYLSFEEVDLLKAACPHLLYVSPYINARGTVKYGREDEGTTVVCVNDEFAWMQGFSMDAGRFFSESDIRGRRFVAVLGRDIADKLFGPGDPIGETIRINDLSCTVIGIMKRRGQSGLFSGMNTEDSYVYLPASIARRITGFDRVSFIMAQATDVESVRLAVDEVNGFLRRRYGEDNRFLTQSSESFLESARVILGIFTAILGGIGGISLLVGGIGVMNIMLVTVTERTREIGIRKAVGARKGDILRQFVTEAVMLCLTGGIIGIIFGALGAHLIAAVSPIPASVSPLAVAVAFASSSLVGLIFGVYPAYKAANLDPIQALRYE
ncbi:MAG TPA: FtsX-like permease family protein [Firmicutes bacterium]|nr:FtsX-like permease family protein [Bacillota bacterium]